MARGARRKPVTNRAAIYARVSDRSQDGEDKTSIQEQLTDMDDYCARRGLNVVERYQEVGRGWSKKRPQFQRMLADARDGRFDTIVCWKSDRLSRGMFPAAALMEVVEAYQVRLESVMDAIDMKTFGLMAAIGKIELDNFRERATMGKRGAAKQGRIPSGKIAYGYRVASGGIAEVYEPQAEVVRRMFHAYVHEGKGAKRIAWDLTDEGVPTFNGGTLWHEQTVHRMLSNSVYKGTWAFGRTRNISTDEGTKVYEQPSESWIQVQVPPLVDEETWNRAQSAKKERFNHAKRNTKLFYLLQHMLRCKECGRKFRAQANWRTSTKVNGERVYYEATAPRRYYCCTGSDIRLRCREKSWIRAEKLESRIWDEVRGVLETPSVIIAGIESQADQGIESFAEEQARAERDLREVQLEEDRLIRLYVAGKITEDQLDHQRKFITERLENLRAKLDDYRARTARDASMQRVAWSVQEWAREVGQGLDALVPEEQRVLLQNVVDEITIDGDNNLAITVAIPIEPDAAIASHASPSLCTSASSPHPAPSPQSRSRCRRQQAARRRPCPQPRSLSRRTSPPQLQ